jgi:hypothetical protein
MSNEPVSEQTTAEPAVKTIQDATAESIFEAGTSVKREPFDIPDAGRVWVHRISAREAKQWSKDCRDDGTNSELYADARLIQRCVFDSAGRKIFAPVQVTRIVGLGADIVIPLARRCLAVNGMAEAGAEEILKNSAATVIGDSSSDSPVGTG